MEKKEVNKEVNKEQSNIQIPAFLMFTILLTISIILLIYYTCLYFSPKEIIQYEGYGIQGKEIADNLMNSKYENKDIEKMLKIEEQSMIFKKINQYYIGENKEKINLNYPIYINNKIALYNYSEKNKIIDEDFEDYKTYPKYILSNGILYFGEDLERVDQKKYLFMKTEDDIFINQYEINIKTEYNEYKIPQNALTYFDKKYISYYKTEKDELKYDRIEDVDLNSKITIDNKEYRYEELLEKLKLTQQKKKEEPKEEIIEEPLEEPKEEIKEEIKEENNEENKEENKEENNEENNEEQQEIYIKPEVKITEFEANVYSAKTTLNIYDPARRITEPISVEFRHNGKIYLKKGIISSGNIEILGLAPNEKYNITASFIYKNEEGKKVRKTLLEQEITTKGLETLEPIALSYENGEIFPNKIQIKDFKISSDLYAEALKGIKKLELEINNVTYKISTSQINNLRRGKTILYETQENIKTNKQINYQFKAYDLKGNELKLENDKGTTKTAKDKPSMKIKIQKQDIGEVILGINLVNRDKTKTENIYYTIKDVKGTTVKEEKIEKNQKQIILTNLDPNQYYSVNIYADYDIEDNNGTKENQEIGKSNFTSVPLSILGYLKLDTNKKEITKDSITLEAQINDEKTDTRLTHILNKITINVYEDTEKNKEKIIQTKIIENEELSKMKEIQKLDIKFNNLKSKTNYKIKMIATLKQGNTKEDVDVIQDVENFITKKKPAEVLIKNQFVTGDMIDFDIKIKDIDEAILQKNVRMEIRDEKDKLIKIENIETNKEFLRLSYEKLTEKSNYTIYFYADEYNEGDNNSTFKTNYLLKRLEIFTEPGINGTIGLENLNRISKGKNLIDVKSEVKWYSNCFYTWNYYDKKFNEKTEELKIYAGKNGYGQYYTYNLKEYAGQTVTISFLAKKDKNSEGLVTYLQNSKTGGRRTRINDIPAYEEEWKRFSYTVTLDNSGYLGFYIVSGNTTYEQSLLLKELQVELGNRRTNYEKYQYNIEGNVTVNLTDRRNEISEKDYYIRIKENGKEKETNRYIEINENGKVENSVKKYNFNEKSNYQIELIVKIRNRFYIISSTEFNTKGEILGIKNKEDFLQIQPNGNYIVLDDIILDNIDYDARYRFGGIDYGLRGKIDFQGHSLKIESKNIKHNGIDGIFRRIEKTGVIENIVIDTYLNHDHELGYYRGIFTYNYGTVRNVMVNLKECTKLPNIGMGLIGYDNYGTIENFVINLETPMYGARLITPGVIYNERGTIKNGYVYGKNVELPFSIGEGQWRDSAGISYQNDKGNIENVYSLINVEYLEQEGRYGRCANLLYRNDRGIVKNVYSIGEGTVEEYNYGPTIGMNNSGKVENSYYFGNKIFNNNYNLKTTNLALYDEKFQNIMLNTYNGFIVDELISQNYYPQVILSSKMPNQEYIPLPKIEDKDLVDILSYNIIEDNNDNIKLEMSIHNPSGEQITSIKVKEIKSRIISQEYKEGKTTLILELKNPVRYTSKYSIMSITSKGAFNIPFTRNYEDNERNIYIDFYRPISTIEDWKQINKSPTENYRLMQDLDFLNCEREILITNKYTGKLDGNGHTIKNIRIQKDINNNLFTTLDGVIKNLNIENFHKEDVTNSHYVGIIGNAYSNTTIDNVHVKNVNLSSFIKNGGNATGGLIARANDIIISNSSVTEAKIKVEGVNNTNIGGLIGEGNNNRISNCFVQDVDIDTSDVLIYYGIGGIIGYERSGITNNCYATGKIQTDAETTGGIYGTGNGIFKSCYSLVNLTSKADYLGGIGGYDLNGNTTSTTQNLSLGKIYSTKQSKYINRILGNTIEEENNYAYKGQKINGFITKDELGAEKLLTEEELKNKKTYLELLDFEDNYSYIGLEQGILPKLKYAGKEEILPNQKDNKLDNEEIYIEEVEAEKQDVNTAIARIVVNNPKNKEIIGTKIEYADVEIMSIINENGKTYINAKVTPKLAYDSYTINKIILKEEGQEKELETQAKIDIQFYKEINSFEDWQKIDNKTAQNYRLNVDIDFTGKINPKTNVSIGRLESEGQRKTIKNIEITASGTSQGLIKEVKNKVRNVNFENITINNKAGYGNYTGIIVRNIGNIENVDFKNIKINAPNIGYAGAISNNSAVEMNNIKLEGITIEGREHVAGLAGITDSGIFKNIDAKKVNIKSKGNFAGSIIGQVRERTPYKIGYLTATEVNVKGQYYVGGIMGHGKMENSKITKSTIEGARHVGGICGELVYNGADTRNFLTEDCTIIGTEYYIGGVAGVSNEVRAAFSIGNTIIGKGANTRYVGGVCGTNWNSLRESASINCKISVEGHSAGGLLGYQSGQIYSSYSKNNIVEGTRDIGGITGTFRAGNLGYTYNDNTVIAYTNTAGGIVGFLNNQDMTGANYKTEIYQSYVANGHITAPTNVGGLIGRIAEPIYDSRYYRSNYIEAYLNSSTIEVSMGIGSDERENSKIERLYVYENSKINNQIIEKGSNYIPVNNYLKDEDLSKESTYRNKIGFSSYYNYSKLKQGKYPLLTGERGIITPQEGIDIPNSQNRTKNLATTLALTSKNTTPKEQLPKIKIYPVDVNEINIEFDKIGNNLKLYYNDGTEKTNEIEIKEKVYTFKYDFKTNIKLNLTDGIRTITKEIKPTEVANTISILNDKTYYLENNKIKTQGEELQGEFVNIYFDKALSNEGKIYDITKQKWEEGITKGFLLQEKVKPKEESEYKGTKISTFANFTTMQKGNLKTQKQGRVLVRNNKL